MKFEDQPFPPYNIEEDVVYIYIWIFILVILFCNIWKLFLFSLVSINKVGVNNLLNKYTFC